ncbi:MAG: phosphate acyltransferase PlsX [Bacteroidota bacterium]|nr:phosphate acyltransferase PlsX [Bacteroidota bacterium]
MTKIGIDAMGGDFAPFEAIKGASLSKQKFPDIDFCLYGDKAIIEETADKEGISLDGLHIVHCSEVIEMGEHPVKAMASKRDSSIFKGFTDLAQGGISAFLSAGNTGAMLVGSIQILKPINGVDRPSLLTTVSKPSTLPGNVLYVGANADNKPEHLQQFGLLGSIYAESILNIQNPRVGLVNIGEEDEKGSILSRAANKLLRETDQINFIGNVEGRDIFTDDHDVLVCDGFTGNVMVKIIEGFYYQLVKRGVQDDFLNGLNFKNHGGGLVLGVKAPVVVGHGISRAETFVKMAELAKQSVESDFCRKVEDAFTILPTENK